MISFGHEFLNTQDKCHSTYTFHQRLNHSHQRDQRGYQSKQKKKKKIIKSLMSKNFMGQENRRNSSYQKKGKVDSPHSLLERFVITWILDQALLSFVGGTGFWIVNQSICPARMRRPQITERKRACSDRGLVGSWRRWQFWEKYILFGIWGKWFQGRGKRIVIFHEANLKSF